jgi:hypothetical protein
VPISKVEDVFTAAQIAAALQWSKRSVLESLKRTPPNGMKIVSGNQARAWSKQALPSKILAALNDVASRREINVDALLASPPPFWRPRHLLSKLTDEAIKRASMLKLALAPALARLNDVDLASAEFEQLGVEDYRRTFGHNVSTRHWRRLFRRTLERDGGAENWGRPEIYLDESLARRPELRKRAPFTPTALRPLQELISSFENPAAPTDLEQDCLWIYAFDHLEWKTERSGKPKTVKREILKFLYENASFLGKSVKGIMRFGNRGLKSIV